MSEIMNILNVEGGSYEVADAVARQAMTALQTDKANRITPTITNQSIASFSDGADGVPLLALKTSIIPTQSGTGDPSPTNIRPITGWTGAKIAHCGKNLISLDMLELPTSGTTIKDTSGEETSSSSSRYTHGYIPVKPNTTYTFRGIYTSPSGSAFMYEYGEHKEWIAKTGVGVISAETSSSVRTTSPNTHFIQIQYIRTADPSTWSFVEGADTDTYPQGTTYPISWSDSAGTVYGGTLDVVNGKLIAYPYYVSYNGETLSGEWISDRDVYAEGTTPTIGAQVAVISGTGTEYTLTAAEVQTLLGVNNLWADCGDITELTYTADTKLYIDNAIATAIAATT